MRRMVRPPAPLAICLLRRGGRQYPLGRLLGALHVAGDARNDSRCDRRGRGERPTAARDAGRLAHPAKASSTTDLPTKLGALMRTTVGSKVQGSRAGRPPDEATDDPLEEPDARCSSATTRSCSAATSDRKSHCALAMVSTSCSTIVVNSTSDSTAPRTAPTCAPRSE